jgi:ubiquinone/menaquinone biosynthesis C-methylase UbiE
MLSKLEAKAVKAGWVISTSRADGGVGNGGASTIKTATMDAQRLTFPDNAFTHSHVNFGILFWPDAEGAAARVYRALKPGGTAFMSWFCLGYLPVVRAARTVRLAYCNPRCLSQVIDLQRKSCGVF